MVAESKSPDPVAAPTSGLEEFKLWLELLKFYTNLVLQVVTFVLSATGAVVAYMVTGKESPHAGPYGFAIPALLCIGMGIGFLWYIGAAIELRDRLNALAEDLGFGLKPHAGVLIGSLWFFGIVLVATGLVLIAIVVGFLFSQRG